MARKLATPASKKAVKKSQKEDFMHLLDIENVDDLPEDRRVLVVKKVTSRGMGSFIMEFFDYCSEISLQMIIAGLYRKHGLSPKKQVVYSALSYLIGQHKIERTATHLYKIIK